MNETEYIQLIYTMFSKIIGCAFASYNYFHDNVDELTYEAGLYCELEEIGFKVHRQEEFPVYYKGRPSPVKRKMDLVVTDKELGDVLLELKAMNFIGDDQRRQLWSYMKLQNFRFGMLINFSPKGVYTENWRLDDKTDKFVRV